MSLEFTNKTEEAFWKNDSAESLGGIRRGVEKESLRVARDGSIARSPHPTALGSKLTHQYITTDYSEALLEFITPAETDPLAPIKWLNDIHKVTYDAIGEELLWPTSMPCKLGVENEIPLANYGSSNSGRMKTVYREGLGHRYGRYMQTIAGVHYNFSFAPAIWQALFEINQPNVDLRDYQSSRYMAVIRNYQRNAWIIPYLFGASPALCETFLKGRPTRLDVLTPGTRYGRFATSLRMSDLGYQNNVQSALRVSTNNLKDYIASLEHAIRTEDPYYKSLGVTAGDHYRQLNANVLQIENEFYSNIRPKQATCSGRRPTRALAECGVEYIEVRAVDTNPFSEVGITQHQMNCLDIFILHCAMHRSAPITEREEAENKKNFARVVKGGRDPEMYLWQQNKQIRLADRVKSLLEEFELAATLLDQAYGVRHYTESLSKLNLIQKDPELSLSGQILNHMQSNKQSFFDFAMTLAEQYKEKFANKTLEPETREMFSKEAKRSIEQQAEIEKSDNKSFEEFLAEYYAD